MATRSSAKKAHVEGDVSSTLPDDYAALLGEIKQRVSASQTRAVLAVNAELVRLYWDIGGLLDSRQSIAGWGAGVIPKLARDLHNELPELKGFSERNFGRMLAFYRAYRDLVLPPAVATSNVAGVLPPAVAKRGRTQTTTLAVVTSELLLAVPWAHHHVLLEKVKKVATRRWYMQQLLTHGWSRNVLALQIDAGAHQRQGAAVSNFAQRLPPAQSDLVQQALKDPYVFDFLTLDAPFHERELETSLVHHLEKFLLELGQGFAFVGRQHRVEVGDDEFFIDLLFYHLSLRSFVVVELKRGKFKPEYAGKLNFYCNVVDERLRHASDNPTIGLLLCKGKNKVLAEYALRGIDKPIGIADYQLTRALPDTLQSALPTIEAIEAELGDLPIEPTRSDSR